MRSELRWRRHVDEKGRLLVVADAVEDEDAAALRILRRNTHVAERATLIATGRNNRKRLRRWDGSDALQLML